MAVRTESLIPIDQPNVSMPRVPGSSPGCSQSSKRTRKEPLTPGTPERVHLQNQSVTTYIVERAVAQW